ncbi:class I SAM-dependent methyltransferase [Archangium gephyra]|uniref:class I SAM-dependent methyltransferase n=1 Tax=Archangium gephyra TaxID=48 RepID=UPI0035D3F639
MVKAAGLDPGRVTFVAADFEKEDWLERLVDAGFDASKPALFLRKLASTARGSVVAFDYITTEPLESRGLSWSLARAAARAGGEPLKSGIESTPPVSECLAGLLQSCGLSLGEHQLLGQETGGKRAWGGFATAVVT